ncbi:MAG: hypothetical protein GVY28_12485, partial [Alphaproteobacteria bacterium]|nr:hypothetical protein [Alphaproteobacteria bacterium]
MADSRSIRAGRASVQLYADNSELIRGLRRARRRLTAFGSEISRLGRQFAAVGAAAGAGLGAAAAVFAKTGDDLDKLSTRTGVSVESLSQLEFAAERTGSSLGELGQAIQRMNRRLGRITAGQGSSTEVNALEALGLSAERLEQLNPEQRLLALADAIANYGDQAEAAGLAQRAFGTQIDRILPLLLQGRDGIRALTEQADQLGGTISDEDVAAAAELSDAFGTLAFVAKRLAVQVGAALGPALTSILDEITTLATRVRDWVDANRGLALAVAGVTAAVTAGGVALAGFGVAVTAIGAGLGALATVASTAAAAIAAIVSPVGLVITAIGAAGGAVLAFTDAGGAALRFLGDTFGGLLDTAVSALEGI